MLEPEVLRVIAAAIRSGCHWPYGDEIADELGLTWDRWDVERYAGNPVIATAAMGLYLERLSFCLGDKRIQALLSEDGCQG